MSLWKTALLVGVVVAAYFAVPAYFHAVAIAAAVAWVAVLVYGLREARRGPEGSAVAQAARLLGVLRPAAARGFRVRWQDTSVSVTAVEARAGGRDVPLLDLSLLTYETVPFCFVIRALRPAVPEADLVENSRIPGTKFEYVLSRVELGLGGFEAASNMPDLLTTLVQELERLGIAERGLRTEKGVEFTGQAARGAGRGVALDKAFFNGRVVHFQVMLAPGATRDDLESALDRFVRFCLTLADLLDNVDFNVPV